MLSKNSKVIRKNPSSRIGVSEDLFFRMTFQYFRKNPSSKNLPEHLLSEVPEEPYTDLPEAATVTTLSPFFSASSTLRFHYLSLNVTTILHNKSKGRLGTPTSKANGVSDPMKTSSRARGEEDARGSRRRREAAAKKE